MRNEEIPLETRLHSDALAYVTKLKLRVSLFSLSNEQRITVSAMNFFLRHEAVFESVDNQNRFDGIGGLFRYSMVYSEPLLCLKQSGIRDRSDGASKANISVIDADFLRMLCFLFACLSKASLQTGSTIVRSRKSSQ